MDKKIMQTVVIILISTFLIASLIVLSATVSNASIIKGGKFFTVSNESSFRVVYDKDTMVMYTVSEGKYNSGNLTLLVDENGKPLLYQGEKHE